MSAEHDSPHTQADCCGEAAVYLLGLLDERHSKLFLEHANSCAICSDDLAALAPAVERLPDSVPQVAAPPDAKRRVMAVVRSEAGLVVRPSPGAIRTGDRRFTLRRSMVALAGAALLAAGVAIGGLTISSGTRGTRVVSADIVPAGVSAALHQSAGHTWLTVAKMPEPSTGHVYEVWVKRAPSASPQPTDSLFAPTSSGTATVAVPNRPGASEVMVTQEPAGGSRSPSSPMIIVARMT